MRAAEILTGILPAYRPPVGIFRGVAPFIVTDLVRLALLVAFPWLALFLPITIVDAWQRRRASWAMLLV